MSKQSVSLKVLFTKKKIKGSSKFPVSRCQKHLHRLVLSTHKLETLSCLNVNVRFHCAWAIFTQIRRRLTISHITGLAKQSAFVYFCKQEWTIIFLCLDTVHRKGEGRLCAPQGLKEWEIKREREIQRDIGKPTGLSVGLRFNNLACWAWLNPWQHLNPIS